MVKRGEIKERMEQNKQKMGKNKKEIEEIKEKIKKEIEYNTLKSCIESNRRIKQEIEENERKIEENEKEIEENNKEIVKNNKILEKIKETQVELDTIFNFTEINKNDTKEQRQQQLIIQARENELLESLINATKNLTQTTSKGMEEQKELVVQS